MELKESTVDRAVHAVGYRSEDFAAASRNDGERLVHLRLGRYPEPGEPIGPWPSRPLGH